MKRFLLGLLALTACGLAQAQASSVTLSWTAPTAYNDGCSTCSPVIAATPLAATDLASYTISWAKSNGLSGGSVVVTPAVAGQAPPTSVIVQGMVCNGYTFTATATTTTGALYPSATSPPSAPFTFQTAVKCAPNPPGGLTGK